ncbi:uncharacterized protein L201_006385 [Kwoniella dendrophila CBS 6074]|uniref:Zn(2)-C6 fungal-type domain-containing protein n=1 Tax=Kwoniella dendrophila CBS 6074 TaxID=1295534 RepID=A0AAX4K228_9TREE
MPADTSDQGRTARRSKEGCLKCRQSRIKCDEVHPVCGRCQSRSISCEWPSGQPMSRKHRNPRSTSRCESIPEDSTSCKQCLDRGEICQRSGSERIASIDTSSDPSWSEQSQIHHGIPSSYASENIPSTSYQPQPQPQTIIAQSIIPVLPSPIIVNTDIHPNEVKELVRLYFRTVHHFGYLSFIHEADYWEMEEHGRAPEELTLLMAAHAIRFGGLPADPARLQQADKWVSNIGDKLTTRVLTEFGVVDLMGVVLCQTYDFLNGKYSRGMVMAGMAVRMMTFLRLHELNEWSRQTTTSKPLIGPESLRRLAWSVWYMDATLDGGNFGSSNIQEDGFTIQLPSDDRPFLLHRHVDTEPLIPKSIALDHHGHDTSPLDLSAHLLRAMCARQALAQAYSRIQRKLFTHPSIAQMGQTAEEKANNLLSTLTSDLSYSRALYHIYRDRTPTLVLLHVVRNNCERHTCLLRILVAQHTVDAGYNAKEERRALLINAKNLSRILADALNNQVALDPQIAMHAYNAIEILLFQPIKLAVEHSEPMDIPRQDIIDACRPLLQVIRNIANVCPLVSLIYPEAVNRMVQMGYVEELTNEDILAVLEKVHTMTNADKEFDWTESFWRYEIFLSRRSRMTASSNHTQNVIGPHSDNLPTSPEDALLEVPTGPSITSPSSNIVNQHLSPESAVQTQSTSNENVAAENPESGHVQFRQTNDNDNDNNVLLDPLTRLQELFGPESNAATPAVYAPMSSFTPSGQELWPNNTTFRIDNLQTQMNADDLNTVVSDAEFRDISLPYPWRW